MRDIPMEVFTERGSEGTQGLLMFCVLNNQCLFVTKETSRTKPLPSKRPWDVLVTTSISESSFNKTL